MFEHALFRMEEMKPCMFLMMKNLWSVIMVHLVGGETMKMKK